jgi:adenylate cyclase
MTAPDPPPAEQAAGQPADQASGQASSDPVSLRAELERAILGSTPELTADEVAAAAGVPLAEALRLWRALGFPDAEGSAAFTRDDVVALGMLGRATELGLDNDTVVGLTRAVGSTLSRLAEWEVGNLTAALEPTPGAPDTPEQRLATAIHLVGQMAPAFDELLRYAWRRHLAVAVARAEPLQVDDETPLATATVGFADLVGFTALSNELDEDAIGDLVEVFESRCHDVVTERRGRIIKSLGDSVLFVADTAADGVDIGLDIIAVIGGDSRLPDVRVGIATGPVTLRLGDVFGPAVNLAARLVTVARRNRTIVDHATADLLPVDDFEVRVLPARPLRGFGDVEPVTVRRTGPAHRPLTAR